MSGLSTSPTPNPPFIGETPPRRTRGGYPKPRVVQIRGGLGQAIEIDSGWARLNRMQNKVPLVARLHEDGARQGGFRVVAVMVTLTYAREEDWRPKHISEYLNRAYAWLARRGYRCRNVWVGELQRRGAVHYHIIFWLPHRVRLPMPDKSGWWCHGSSRIERARNPVNYLSKYASKGDDTTRPFPKGLRMHGCGGLETRDRRIAAWAMLPRMVRNASEPGDVVKRVPGGGFLIERTGEFIRSRWRFAGFCNGTIILRDYGHSAEPLA